MIEVEAVKTAEQRQQVEAHLADHGELYADIWKVGGEHRASYFGSVVIDHGRHASTGY